MLNNIFKQQKMIWVLIVGPKLKMIASNWSKKQQSRKFWVK